MVSKSEIRRNHTDEECPRERALRISYVISSSILPYALVLKVTMEGSHCSKDPLDFVKTWDLANKYYREAIVQNISKEVRSSISFYEK